MEHLDCLQLRLSNERIRLANAKSEEERELRKVWIAQISKEIEDEAKFVSALPSCELTTDELLAELLK